MKSVRCFALILCLLLSVIFTGCQPSQSADPTPAPTQFTPSALPWTMKAFLVDAEGKVLEQAALVLDGRTWTDDRGDEYCTFRFAYPDSILHQISGPMPAPKDSLAYPIISGVSQELGQSAGAPAAFYIGLDLEKGCLIADFNDEKDVYLIASCDPSATADTLWTHFAGFFAARPSEFPSTSLG